MKNVSLLLLVLICLTSSKALGQSSGNKMIVKVDLLSPILIIPQLRKREFDRRFSVESEMSLKPIDELFTTIFDIEFISHRSYISDSIYSTVVSWELNPSAGIRFYFPRIWKPYSGFFLEPRLAIGLLRKRLFPFSGTAPIAETLQMNVHPRLKTGFSYPLSDRIFSSISLEFVYKKQAFPDTRRLTFFPEINLGILF